MKQAIVIWGVAGVAAASLGYGVYHFTRSEPNASSDASSSEASALTSTGAGASAESNGAAAAASARSAPDVISCGGAPNGTKCGKTGTAMLCVFDSCTKNACGDALVLEGEACDDGNRDSGDGCSATCQWEALPKCGNGSLDEGEQCDDGNRSDTDKCTVRCTDARCGDGAEGPGEKCDDGNLDDTDECTAACVPPDPNQLIAAVGTRLNADGTISIAKGSSAAGVGAAGAAGGHSLGAAGTGTGATGTSAQALNAQKSDAGTADEACKACTERECRSFHNQVDLVRGCYEAVNSEHGARADASFLQQCADLVSCSHAHECWTDSFKLGAGCYCGNIGLDDCLRDGPSQDAPCVAEFAAAARTSNHQEIMNRMSDFAFPSAWGYFYLECEAKNCRSVCVESGV